MLEQIREGIDFNTFGFGKLAEFVEYLDFLEVFTDTSIAPPVKYVHYKTRGNTQRTRRAFDKEEVEQIKRRLRLDNNFFIGQFIPQKTEGWYKIVDIRNTDFTKIEDKERGIKDLTISFRSQDKEFNRFAYYKFTWVLL